MDDLMSHESVLKMRQKWAWNTNGWSVEVVLAWNWKLFLKQLAVKVRTLYVQKIWYVSLKAFLDYTKLNTLYTERLLKYWQNDRVRKLKWIWKRGRRASHRLSLCPPTSKSHRKTESEGRFWSDKSIIKEGSNEKEYTTRAHISDPWLPIRVHSHNHIRISVLEKRKVK